MSDALFTAHCLIVTKCLPAYKLMNVVDLCQHIGYNVLHCRTFLCSVLDIKHLRLNQFM